MVRVVPSALELAFWGHLCHRCLLVRAGQRNGTATFCGDVPRGAVLRVKLFDLGELPGDAFGSMVNKRVGSELPK